MKRYAICRIVPVAVLLLCLASSGVLAKKTTLRFMARGGTVVVQNLRKIIKEFEESHPNIVIKLEDSSSESYVTKLLTQISAGSAPDVVFSSMGEFRILAKGGSLAPLDRWVTADKIDFKKYYDIAIESGRYKGKLYAWPYDGGSYAMHYNKDMFNKAGLTYPDESWDWNRVVEVSKKLFIRSSDGKVTQSGIQDARYLWWYFTWLNGGDIVSANGRNSTLSSPECIETVKWLSDLTNRTGLMGGGLTAPSCWFDQGKIGMYFEGRWGDPWLRSTKFKWDVSVAPKGKAGTLNLAFYSGFSMVSTTKYPKESWEFIKYIGGEPGQKVLCALGQQVPAIRSLAESGVFLNSTPPNNNRAYLKCMEKAKAWPTLYITLFGGRYSQLVDPLLAQVWAGKRSPEQVLTKDLDSKLNALLDRN